MGDTGVLLDRFRRIGDASADAVIEELARTQQIRAVSHILRHLVDNDQPVPDELPPSIARWLMQTAELPAWVDRERFEGGCRLVVEHGPQVCVVLATASVYCYAGYPDTFYILAEAAKHYPTEALARYLQTHREP